MVYDFDLKTVAPIIQGLLTTPPQENKPIQPLPLLTEQPVISEQPPPEVPEQRSGTEMVNAAMENAIPQAPNPYAVNIQRGIVQAKQNYGNAKNDDERATAQSQAALLRDIASAAGINLSGYGADDSYGDAYKNLASQEARDIMGALQGQYTRNSGQYYNDKFLEGIMRGLSPRKSRKVAEALTGDYQADRVQYLDGLLNSYGRDGLVMNEYGNQILGMMAHEDPMLASLYTGIYPNAKEAYNTATDIAKEAAKHGYALDLLGVGHEYDKENRAQAHAYNMEYQQQGQKNAERNMGLTYYYGQKGADNDLGRKKDYYTFTSDVDLAKEKEKAKTEFDLFKDKTNYLKSLEPKELTAAEKVYKNSFMAAKLYGRSDEEAAQFAGEQAVKSAIYGVEGIKGAGSGKKSSDEPKMTAEQQEKYNTYKNLLNVAHDSHSDDDIARLEEFINGEDGVGKTFSPELYQGFNDTLNALKGFQRKMLNDDDGATDYWSRVKDVNILEQMYPNYNFDYYWERRGGKSK